MCHRRRCYGNSRFGYRLSSAGGNTHSDACSRRVAHSSSDDTDGCCFTHSSSDNSDYGGHNGAGSYSDKAGDYADHGSASSDAYNRRSGTNGYKASGTANNRGSTGWRSAQHSA